MSSKEQPSKLDQNFVIMLTSWRGHG